MDIASPTPLVVLLVDDEPFVRLIAIDMLEDAGFSTFEAADAAQALQHISDHPEIDLLFADINMPGDCDGLELAHLVHRDRADLRLILTSGRERPVPAQMPARGRFLPKPYTFGALVDLIRAA